MTPFTIASVTCFSDNPDGPTTPIGDDPAFAVKPPCPQSITRVI